MEDPDFLMALELQKEFDQEADGGTDSDIELTDFKYDKKELVEFKKRKWDANRKTDLDETRYLVHPMWETLDPTPDVFALFGAFDDKFFQGKLKCVTLEWSKRMYSCAGICYSRRNRLGMAITIRLSEPLLKLRSRKDLVETLLHEMIHAYLSVLNIKEGNGGHGPNFKKIMQTINKVAGTNITVYHTFHDEVDIYKTHWWRCNGICQHRRPFFGYVKRTSNRPPGPNDVWWRQHLESCGGSFLKVREPEKKIKNSGKSKENKTEKSKPDIRKFFGDTKPAPKTFSTGIKSNGGGTVVLNKKNNFTENNNFPKSTTNVGPSQKPVGNLANVVGFKDLTSTPTTPARPITFEDCAGRSLCSTQSTSQSLSLSLSIDNNSPKNNDREKVRNFWANRYLKPNSSEKEESPAKKPRTEIIDPLTDEEAAEPVASSSPVQQKDWVAVDDDVMFKEEEITIVDISSDEDNDEIVEKDVKPNINGSQSLKNCTAEERQQIIKQEILDADGDSDDEIEILDDDYDDNYLNGVVDIADTSLIDDIFGEDTLMKDFKSQNGIYSKETDYLRDTNHDIIMCPICQERIVREVFGDHLDGCTGIVKKIQVFPSTSKFKKPVTIKKQKTKNSALLKEIVPNAMRETPSTALNSSTSSGDSELDNSIRQRHFLDTSTHACPVCAQDVDVDKINEHLDVCLKEKN